jgi:CRP-like cAMP-binding protein
MDIDQVKSVLKDIIPRNFTEFSHSIGSTNKAAGYHGYIALLIYVDPQFLKDSHFIAGENHVKKQEVKRGANLGVTRASNKGAVCISIPMTLTSIGAVPESDTVLTFISCHLSADKHGNNNVMKRHKDANEILKDIGLLNMDKQSEVVHREKSNDMEVRSRLLSKTVAKSTSYRQESNLVEEPHRRKRSDSNNHPFDPQGVKEKKTSDALKGHIVLMGDLNYRLDLEPDEALTIVGDAIQKWDQYKDGSGWHELFSNHDQLTKARVQNEVFPGFKESAIFFPPTFRREIGSEILRNDVSLETLRKCYTTQIQEPNGTYTKRTPSYTDRILWREVKDKEDNAGLLGELVCEQYTCVDSVRTSDHSPVFARMRLVLPSSTELTDWDRISGNAPFGALSYFTVASLVKSRFFSLLVQRSQGDGGLKVARVDYATLQKITQHFRLQHEPGGKVLFKEGEIGDIFYIMLSGSVEMTSTGLKGPNSPRIRLATIHADDGNNWFGEWALVQNDNKGGVRQSTVSTLSPCIFLTISGEEFAKLRQTEPDITAAFDRVIRANIAKELEMMPFFADIKKSRISLLMSLFKFHTYEENEVVVREGDRADSFQLLVSGKVKVSSIIHDANGTATEHLLSILRRGDYFGEVALLQESVRTATVTTIEPCTFLSLQAINFTAFCQVVPEFEERFKKLVADRMVRPFARPSNHSVPSIPPNCPPW